MASDCLVGDSELAAINAEQSLSRPCLSTRQVPSEAEGRQASNRKEAVIAALGLGEAGPALGLGFGVELFEVRGPH